MADAVEQTDVLKLNKPPRGFFDWADVINENWDKLDILGAGQLPILTPLEVRHKLQDEDLIGWTMQGGVLDGNVATSVWDLLWAAKQRAISTTKQIKGVTYTLAQDPLTGFTFVDSSNYNKALDNLDDSLGFICTYNEDENVKYIRLPADKSFNLPIFEEDGIPGGFVDESLPDVDFRMTNVILGNGYTASGAVRVSGSGTNISGSGSGWSSATVNFAASNVSDTYQEGGRVLPRSHQTYRYYKTGNTVSNVGQLNLGNLTSSVSQMRSELDTLITAVADAVLAPPDVTKGVSISSGDEMEEAGWVFVSSNSGGGFQSGSVAVDGVTLMSWVNLDGTKWTGNFRVGENATVTFSSASCKFYPDLK